ncbi:rhodanese-like domain-containing protein (plasmid) [Rathayibacter sp. VKM Ac-2759]|uniref:rhodanese-like domain-containing protein n=1 Tax=Rathayibacter sp. VKM Ac-2759 TaxID=2609252 RepID=UPI001315E85C|nr:rhodanese-like domain-containing protein [Rathayibacter sp. VKM Ac-2759]QHC68705.1 rhodanese-like domain-containing protein [Rathayibacter sp. VKM Ac-2759]
MIEFFTRLLRRSFTGVSVPKAKELVLFGATLVDVRTAQEWRTGHVPAAKHVPLDILLTERAGIRKDRPVVLMCHSGARSATGARLLAQRGYTAYSLRGGITAWRSAGEPIR